MSKNVVTNQKNQAYQQEVERKRLVPIYETIGTQFQSVKLTIVNTLPIPFRCRQPQASTEIDQHPSEKASRISAGKGIICSVFSTILTWNKIVSVVRH